MKNKRLNRLKKQAEFAEAELERCPVGETDQRLADYIRAKEIYNKYSKEKV